MPTASGSTVGAAAEEQQREQQQDREGEQLGAPEVLGDGVADLVLGEHRAAEQDAAVCREALLEAGDHVVLVGGRVQRGEEVGLLAVAAEHRLLGDARDPGLVLQLGA